MPVCTLSKCQWIINLKYFWYRISSYLFKLLVIHKVKANSSEEMEFKILFLCVFGGVEGEWTLNKSTFTGKINSIESGWDWREMAGMPLAERPNMVQMTIFKTKICHQKTCPKGFLSSKLFTFFLYRYKLFCITFCFSIRNFWSENFNCLWNRREITKIWYTNVFFS